MSKFDITTMFNSIEKIQDNNAKVFIDAEKSELKESNTKRSIFKKSVSKTLNENSNETLTILKAALESKLSSKGLAIYNQFITGKKAKGTQRLTVADFKAIKEAVEKAKDNEIVEPKGKDFTTSKLNAFEDKVNKKNIEFTNLNKNSSNEIRNLLQDYEKLLEEYDNTSWNNVFPKIENINENNINMREYIVQKINELQSLLNCKANTFKNFAPAFELKINAIVQSAQTLVDHLTSKVNNSNGQNQKLQTKNTGLVGKLKDIQTKYNNILTDFKKLSEINIMKDTEVPTKYFKIFKTANKNAKKDLEGIIKACGYPNKNLVKDCYNDALSKQDWKTYSKEMKVEIQNCTLSPESHIIPVSKLSNNKNVNYGEGINGIPSSDTTSKHLTNFCKTQLKLGNEVLFEGFRHGVIDAYDVKNPGERIDCRTHKAFELIRTIVADKFTNDILNGKGMKQDNPIELTINSMSLLTPICVTEGEMQKNQHDVLKYFDKELKEKPLTLTINGKNKQVYIKLTINTYAFSTDFGGQGYGLFSKRVWHNGDKKYNNVGFNAMFGKDIAVQPKENVKLNSNVQGLNIHSFKAFINKFKDEAHKETSLGKFLETASVADQKKAYILYSEIQLLKQKKRYNAQGADLFALPARMAMLSHLMGEVTCFNCRSGKDRTGMLDVRVKALATRMSLVDNIFDAESYLINDSSIVKKLIKKEPYSDVDRKIVTTFAEQSGNLEIQQYNTGIKGSKVMNIKGIINSFVNEDSFKFIKGMSSYAKS